MVYGLMLCVILCIAMSIRTLFMPAKLRYKLFSFENFLFLAFTYSIIMMGFGLLYMLCEVKGMPIITEHNAPLEGNFPSKFGTCLYLSAMTLFSVGFGDIIPHGFGRFLVVLEALLGYTLPAAFVVKSMFGYEESPVSKKQ
ncbi:potassium channel family protein [Heyndrickxia acidicola]|uniref:Potassium channel family protein n=1 Tax=Heyndrickxia acidicola TaxID=209389 RepID=A0ABU6MJW3_9BACI|nr:potassium channel family protein [Heyndrickxia acidicola]MED1204961.1 potassium channel family protein [Heyndrickxia acidicola]